MVEPFGIAALSGLSAISGAVLSKFKKKEIQEEIPESSVEFINVKDSIYPNQLLPFMENGKSIFINTKNITDKAEFIRELQEFAVDNNWMVNKVSSNLLFVFHMEQKINIRTLTKQEKLPRKLDIEVNAS